MTVVNTGCRDCAQDRDHCHGTLIQHSVLTSECTEGEACSGAQVTHEFWIACTDLDEPCGDDACREVA